MENTISLDKLHNKDLLCYVLWVIAISILFRLVITFLRTVEYKHLRNEVGKDIDNVEAEIRAKKPWKRYCIIFYGISTKDPFPDLWYNTILGVLELSVFPYLMVANQYTIIGAWIALKTVPQWASWTKTRYIFNRFLIATAILVLISFIFLRPFILISK